MRGSGSVWIDGTKGQKGDTARWRQDFLVIGGYAFRRCYRKEFELARLV
jgi:hypothetical protein